MLEPLWGLAYRSFAPLETCGRVEAGWYGRQQSIPNPAACKYAREENSAWLL